MDWTGCDIVEVVPARSQANPSLNTPESPPMPCSKVTNSASRLRRSHTSFTLNPEDVRRVLAFVSQPTLYLADRHESVVRP